jgi:hypothetical protein
MDTGQVFFCTALLKLAEGCNNLSGWPPCTSLCSDFHGHGTEGSHERHMIKYRISVTACVAAKSTWNQFDRLTSNIKPFSQFCSANAENSAD